MTASEKTAIVDELKKSVKSRFDVPGFTDDVLDKIAEPALKAAVEKTKTKLDDMAFAALYPVLEEELKKLYHEIWDGLFQSGGSVEPGEPV